MKEDPTLFQQLDTSPSLSITRNFNVPIIDVSLAFLVSLLIMLLNAEDDAILLTIVDGIWKKK